MNDLAWLKRKYPVSWTDVLSVFGLFGVEYLRRGYLLGKLTESVGFGDKNDFCLYKRTKEYIEDIDSDGHILNSGWTGQFETDHITSDGKFWSHDFFYSFRCDEVEK